MATDEFLDTNIIVDYVNYNDSSSNKIKISYDYVVGIKGKIILCGMVISELQKLINRRSRIHKAVLCMAEDPDYDLSQILYKKEIPFAKKLHAKFGSMKKEKLSELFSRERALFEMRVERFLKFMVSERVIPEREIDMDLANEIRGYIDNFEDSKILASALQFQNIRGEIFNFVTSDSHDFDPNTYEEIMGQDFFSKYKFPKLVNLAYQ